MCQLSRATPWIGKSETMSRPVSSWTKQMIPKKQEWVLEQFQCDQ